MDNPSLSKRFTSFDLPKATDAGFSQWATKVRAIQDEVDRDAEDEERRLREEIESSRLERARRRNTASVDWTKNASTAISSLQKSSGEHGNKVAKDIDVINKRPLASESKPNDPKEPISLAAFIGGRATKPVLTKPAPQVNYDPGLYDFPKHDGPHPIFGRTSTHPSPAQPNANTANISPQPKIEVAPLSVSNNTSPGQKPTPLVQVMSLAEAVGGQGSGPRLTRSLPVKEDSEVTGVSALQGRPLPGLTKTQNVPPVPPSASKPAKPSFSQPSPTSADSVARSSHPPVNVSPSNIKPESSSPSPAFLRPIPTTEELHPSLTKLQGRGFVGQRVRAVTPSKESSSEHAERTNSSPPDLRKRPSVLDRWQPASNTPPAITERTKTFEQMKTAQKLEASPLTRSTNDASKGIIGGSTPVRLPGMASGDVRRSAYKMTEPNPIVTPVPATTHKSTSVMANTTLNHPTRGRPKKPKKEKHAHTTVISSNDSDSKQRIFTESTEFIPPSSGTIDDSPPQDAVTKVLVAIPAQPTSPIKHANIPSVESPTRSPNRHSRIPSTGQRPTVMDVAQALIEHEQITGEQPEQEQRQVETRDAQDEGEISRPDVRSIVARWGRNFVPASSSETRKSSYERYSVATATTLPPLVEVQTPADTPQASLSRSAFNRERAQVPLTHTLQEGFQGLNTNQGENDTDVKLPEAIRGSSRSNEDEMVELEFQAKLPPPFNPQQVIKEPPFVIDSTIQAISIEVNNISDGAIIPITHEQNIFYDTEVIVVIYRSKSNSSELVSNQAWIWRGKNSNWDREERKATDLAGRFDKKAVNCFQGSEPPLLIHVLGGVLATRQGSRFHWSAENTTMHRVHQIGDCMFVDEIDLGVWNLCSAYSYCLSILGTIYIWHGRGSSEDEQKVALTFAATISQKSLPMIEFNEGSEDSVFWMILGQAGYANAHHWKFRNHLDRLGARIYAIDSSKTRTPVQALPSAAARELVEGAFVIDCRLEVYILIKAEARGKRTDIQLALTLAENIASAAAHKRPFTPPVHVVVLPSKLPLELRAALRFCEEDTMNGGEVPDHMNLVTLSDAVDHMRRSIWPRSALADTKFLPVGVDPCMLSSS